MPSSWAAEREYQLVIDISTSQQVQTTGKDVRAPSPGALSLDALTWRNAPKAVDHLTSMTLRAASEQRKGVLEPTGCDAGQPE